MCYNIYHIYTNIFVIINVMYGFRFKLDLFSKDFNLLL